ncbi:MAG: hypothetical protein ACFHWX_15925 [Bacteroidota bacterium]
MSRLYRDENEVLEDFQKKIDTKSYTHEDIVAFKELFEGQTAESQVMLKISDRLQKRLDTANTKIKEKNEEIVNKNEKLNEALDNLMKARVGKKASTIMFTITILIFISEEYYLGPFLEYLVGYAYLILILKGVVAIGLKSFESVLENIFVNGAKKKIIKEAREEQPKETRSYDMLEDSIMKQSSAA